MADSELLKTPLYDRHVAAGGKMVPFAGYSMPVQYAGIIAEAKAVRHGSGMFDVSHMARLRFRGEGATAFIDSITSNDVAALGDYHGHYSLLPNEHGGTVDDIIVTRVSAAEFRVVVNASNHEKDVAWIQSRLPSDVEMIDETGETAMIAVQGPAAVSQLAQIAEASDAVSARPFFGAVETSFGGIRAFGSRSGYTGEDGYELVCDANDAPALWDALVEAGVTPCGLGSRDTLRVEAGLPLYGHELDDDRSPIAAGLGWVISKTKTFVGATPINEARANGTPSKLLGVRLEGKRLLTPYMQVSTPEGKPIGFVSSGVISPMLDCGIAFAFLDSTVAIGSPCTIDVRGKQEPGQVVNKRFFKRAK